MPEGMNWIPTIKKMQWDAENRTPVLPDYGDMTPSYDRFIADYFKGMGWEEKPFGVDPSNVLNLLSPEERSSPEYQKMESQAQKWKEYSTRYGKASGAYREKYGKTNMLRSDISGPLSYVLPTVSKLVNPERPEIKWYDPLWDIGTVATLGAGGVGGWGGTALRAAGEAMFAAGAAGHTADTWDESSTLGKAFNVGMTGLGAVGAGFSGKALYRKTGEELSKAVGQMAERELAATGGGVPRDKMLGMASKGEPPARNVTGRDTPLPMLSMKGKIFPVNCH